jgi:ADP-L-glycero-D-manno-heptose 6-epimerase
MASAILRMVPSAKNDGVIRLFKSNDPQKFPDGEQKRDFIYVKDVARMTCAFLENDATGIYNIGSGHASSWNELARAVFSALGMPPKIQYIDMPSDLNDKYQNYTCADVESTRAALGDAAKTMPLDKAVGEYVREYLLPEKRW